MIGGAYSDIYMNELTEGARLDLSSNFTAVKFYSTECLPCKKLDGVFLKMEKEFQQVNFTAVNIDQHLNIAQNFQIMSVPTIIFFLGEKEVSRIQGLVNTESLRKAFKTLVSK